jgi:hypothetical protein
MLRNDRFPLIFGDSSIFLPFSLIYLVVWTALSVRQVLLDLRQRLADLFPEVPPHEFGEFLIAVGLGDWRSSRGASPGLAGRAGWKGLFTCSASLICGCAKFAIVSHGIVCENIVAAHTSIYRIRAFRGVGFS